MTSTSPTLPASQGVGAWVCRGHLKELGLLVPSLSMRSRHHGKREKLLIQKQATLIGAMQRLLTGSALFKRCVGPGHHG